MLERGRARRPASVGEGATIVEPVYIEDGCTIEHATVGPNVSMGAGCTVRHASVANAVIGEHTRIEHAHLHDAFLGDRVVVTGVNGRMSVGDDSNIQVDA